MGISVSTKILLTKEQQRVHLRTSKSSYPAFKVTTSTGKVTIKTIFVSYDLHYTVLITRTSFIILVLSSSRYGGSVFITCSVGVGKRYGKAEGV